MIKVLGLSKSYKSKKVLQNVSFTVDRGETFALTGPNGSGSTTLLHILATLERPTSGTVQILGVDIIKNPFQARRLIGYLPENYNFGGELRVREYLDFVASSRMLGKTQKALAVKLALQRTDLDSEAETRFLSRGLCQQLALASALLHAPKVLLLDEPLNHLDSRAKSRATQILKSVQEQGTTIVVACNALYDVGELSDRVGFFRSGQLVEIVDMQDEKVNQR